MRDYERSGLLVEGLVGVAGSPSCGITKTLDVESWLAAVAGAGADQLSPDVVNQAVISSARPGEGWFMSAIIHRLARRGMAIPMAEHDLIAELSAQPVATGSTTCVR